jgi:3-hydroxymyristoyl/3-hydroxydecanoyl-(acyl carrier protein) dehydratase
MSDALRPVHDVLPHGPMVTYLTEVTELLYGEDGNVSGALGYYDFPPLDELLDPSHPHHHLSDHVRGYVLFGGNNQAEAVALLGCYAALHYPKYKGKFLALSDTKHDGGAEGFLVDESESRIPRAVLPGDRLDLEVHLDSLGRNFGQGHGHTSVLGQVACKVSKVKFVVLDPAKKKSSA